MFIAIICSKKPLMTQEMRKKNILKKAIKMPSRCTLI